MVPVGHSSPSQRPNPILRSEYRQQGCLAAFDQGLFYLDTHGKQNVCRALLGAAMGEEASVLAG